MEEDKDDSLNAITQETQVRVAMDSGSCRNATHPTTLPQGVKVDPNLAGKHFPGAGGEAIEEFGACMTGLEGTHGRAGCKWDVADGTRPTHSVSRIAGPAGGDGNMDVLFNNKTCYVVPPGVVERIMREVKAVAEYPREGNLYVAEMELSGFTREGASR